MATLYFGGDMELKRINELLTAPLKEIGYELVAVTYGKENGVNTLSVTVDRDEPISLNDIVLVSDLVSTILDKEDPIEDQYYLDVSSLGAEKPIDVSKLEKYVNSYVRIHLTNPYKGENYLEGDLVSVSEEVVILKIRIKSNSKNVELSRKDIDKARLAIKF